MASSDTGADDLGKVFQERESLGEDETEEPEDGMPGDRTVESESALQAAEEPLADEEEDPEDEAESEILLLDALDDAVEWIECELTVSYDDHFNLCEQSYGTSDGQTITISDTSDYQIYEVEEEKIGSYQVSKGKNTKTPDAALITPEEEDGTDVIATGVGSETVYLLTANDIEKLETSQENAEEITGYQIALTVEPATLTLMFLAGQSNMEGYCSSSTGYQRTASVACGEGMVYSTYAPTTSSHGKNITGITYDTDTLCTTDNAAEFVAGSLQEGTNMSGDALAYPLNSLTAAGSGKTGPDSGLAYEWNRLTGEKVWVVNTAWGGTGIQDWVPGGTYYDRSKAVWQQVEKTYAAEIDAGHYTAGETLVFWLQGEANHAMSAENYTSYFNTMYADIQSTLDPTACGIILTRAASDSSTYATEGDLAMTGPRIAQYGLGNKSGNSVYVVSNANEQWVTDSGVESYFTGAYPNGWTYPMHGASVAVPTKVSEVHSDIHYSQVAHNENGITAADGMWQALNGASVTGVTWRDADGQKLTSLTFDYTGLSGTLVAVADPVYAAKKVSYICESGVSYDAATGTVTAKKEGTYYITATSGGTQIGQMEVRVNADTDLSSTYGGKTGVYKYNGTWYYLINGIIQTDYTGVADYKNDNGWWYIKNGVVDFSYTGLAKNKNGWWYVEDGKVRFNYTGFAENSNGKWYCEDSKVTFKKNDVIKDTTGAIGTKGTWYYVVGSKVQTSYTGVADYKNSNGWWYIKKGAVDFSYTGLAKNKNGWWYVEGGQVKFSYTGFAENSNGKWYCEKSKVTFKKNDVIKDTTGAIGTKGTWYYVVGSKVQTSYTGVADYKNKNGWWYIRNGQVDFTANTVAKNKNGWWYVLGGKVQFGFTGLADYKNSNGWWYIENGKVDFNAKGVYKNKNGWWYVKNGKVQFGYNGIAENSNGWWYIKNGKVDFSYTGKVTTSKATYTVTKGKVNR